MDNPVGGLRVAAKRKFDIGELDERDKRPSPQSHELAESNHVITNQQQRFLSSGDSVTFV